ncbi:F-box/WD repeat-containing protein 9-like isoform X1 [Temnothorax curvispinosus]|uniref:F-box/WD repeat-containing protein 9-like isoform X1 n=1 Tax=Temnothorax curvispinosus TaxID=300111 RepID=A0A6J1R159_9HYME|nr:F-box/WD repeat-containing protein 9-like isoform X1 [Temnothorax curvispinosus]XP_024886561.1 F-box/WD repeat-containing protein 9-like isoform X1 [Temnothorax curvispinosus]XP_024886562.1 F-box/WD repeat-containing protein 9-like isoform X1 [Temnothorax curvispinosus]
MDDENASCAHDDEEYAQLSLLHLPVEVFLHICSFLDASTLHSLSLVCNKFYRVLNDAEWKVRINHILWPNATDSLFCPARPNKLFWKLSCAAIEKQTALWKQSDSMEKLMLMNSHVKAVLLMHVDGITYLVCQKDRILLYKKLSYSEEPFYEVRDYLDNVPSDCLMAIDHTVYVCSYNNIIKSWVLTNTGLVHDRTYEIEQSNRIRDSLMCVSSCPEQALFATGSNHGTINVFDSRSSNKPIRQYRPSYSRYVDKLTMNTKYILSASEDETVTVSVWDQRADRIVKSITIPGERGEYPTCMSMRRDWVCVGNTKKLHMLDLTNDFELVKSYSTEHTETLTGVRLTHGCLITSSYDGTVRISSPTDPPKHIATLCPKIGAIDSMDYLNDTLAIAGGSLVVWRPRNQRV